MAFLYQRIFCTKDCHASVVTHARRTWAYSVLVASRLSHYGVELSTVPFEAIIPSPSHAVYQPLLGDSRRLNGVSEAAVSALSLPVDLVCGP